MDPTERTGKLVQLLREVVKDPNYFETWAIQWAGGAELELLRGVIDRCKDHACREKLRSLSDWAARYGLNPDDAATHFLHQFCTITMKEVNETLDSLALVMNAFKDALTLLEKRVDEHEAAVVELQLFHPPLPKT